MEIKKYQMKVIEKLRRFLELLSTAETVSEAYKNLWEEQGVGLGPDGMPAYQNIIRRTPHVCFKVPTGGGKTYLACNSLKPVFDALSPERIKVAVWLVPTDTILEQTVENLKDTAHPYRQKIDGDFGGRVEVYTKEELLGGKNFNYGTVTEQLSILVLSYDSFRSSRKEGRKAYQENSSLLSFQRALGEPEYAVKGADKTSLIQVISQLSPFVIVDESHHARSSLSLEMLENFNPCFVLDLTATPRPESNIIAYVDAAQLKEEHMVKLPVVVYNRDSQTEVIADAIDLRNNLEKLAEEEEKRSGRYIRPIVLFQAQPRGREDSATFQKLKEKLIASGVPAGEIAIKTAEVNELRDKELTGKDCSIRYIITVNALKEGWDCPFAYVLATLANKTSRVDVEQVIGRILRQPYTKQCEVPALNMSYVLTSSNDFRNTVDEIVKGLNSAGFSSRDCRVPGTYEEAEGKAEGRETCAGGMDTGRDSIREQETETEEFLDFDDQKLEKELLKRRERNERQTEPLPLFGAASMLQMASEQLKAYEKEINHTKEESFDWPETPPQEVRDRMKIFHMKPEFKKKAMALQIPVFYLETPYNIITGASFVPLCQEHLTEGFTLKGKPYDIRLDHISQELYRVDVEGSEDAVPKAFKMNEMERAYFREILSKLPEERRIQNHKEIICKHLSSLNQVDSLELAEYVDRIVDNMNRDQLAELEKMVFGYAEAIKKKVLGLLKEHQLKQFQLWLEQGKITCRPHYRLPETISPVHAVTTIGMSLYTGEERMNSLEHKMVMVLTSLKNVVWWHRNIAKRGLNISGFENHYPDLLVFTDKGNLIVVETKSEHLENWNSKDKLMLGRAWEKASGSRFRYYMVFDEKHNDWDGAVTFEEFFKIIPEL
ncbi:DEAD/DEAH box helicase [Qiania dongpingensis]|uniref:DEAD/DEAH box helicase family protein n=1 Tax=Qiania dongpingensis TaxID=2763669 RepID=A0A7G9G647_9FIRM|nr:DEAD/DEAH box helicase family protein [Qiania dongpingensis]QNM06279.1 DEAD/DEAH box helicase family protein [Qiania dongpingensis]